MLKAQRLLQDELKFLYIKKELTFLTSTDKQKAKEIMEAIEEIEKYGY